VVTPAIRGRVLQIATFVTVLSLGVTAGAASAWAHKSLSSELKALSSKLSGSQHATYKAVYTETSSGQTQTITIEADGSKSLYTGDGGLIIDTGTNTYSCSNSSGSEQCISSGTGPNPFASITEIFSPKTTLAALRAAQIEAGLKGAGYSVSVSNATFAGQPAQCFTTGKAGQSGKYCVTNSGILAYVGGNGAGGGSFRLTSYSNKVSSSAFTLPAGATVVTIPKGINLPKGVTLPT